MLSAFNVYCTIIFRLFLCGSNHYETLINIGYLRDKQMREMTEVVTGGERVNRYSLFRVFPVCYSDMHFVCFFLILSIPVNNFSVMLGRDFLG